MTTSLEHQTNQSPTYLLELLVCCYNKKYEYERNRTPKKSI